MDRQFLLRRTTRSVTEVVEHLGGSQAEEEGRRLLELPAPGDKHTIAVADGPSRSILQCRTMCCKSGRGRYGGPRART